MGIYTTIYIIVLVVAPSHPDLCYKEAYCTKNLYDFSFERLLVGGNQEWRNL